MNREDGATLARKASKEQSRISDRQRSNAVVHQGRIGASGDALPQIFDNKTVIVGGTFMRSILAEEAADRA